MIEELVENTVGHWSEDSFLLKLDIVLVNRSYCQWVYKRWIFLGGTWTIVPIQGKPKYVLSLWPLLKYVLNIFTGMGYFSALITWRFIDSLIWFWYGVVGCGVDAACHDGAAERYLCPSGGYKSTKPVNNVTSVIYAPFVMILAQFMY